MNKTLYILIVSTLLFSGCDSRQDEVEFVIKPQFDATGSFSEVTAEHRGSCAFTWRDVSRLCRMSKDGGSAVRLIYDGISQ